MTSTNPNPVAVSFNDMEEVEKVFNRFDANGDGKISSVELGNVLRALGSSPSDGEVRRMMDEIDTDGDGYIDLKEFAEFHCRGTVDGGDMKDAFDTYDEDKDGLISSKELHGVLEKLGETCSIDDCERMISFIDSDGDGYVNFEEFKKMITTTSGKPNAAK